MILSAESIVIFDYLFMDIVTFFIAVVGFGLSIYNAIHAYLRERVKLSVYVQKVNAFPNRTALTLSISNGSADSISITNLSVWHENKWLDCQQLSESCSYKDSSRTDNLPISLSEFGARQCVIMFRGLPASAVSTQGSLRVRVCTNRRKKLVIQLSLPADRNARC